MANQQTIHDRIQFKTTLIKTEKMSKYSKMIIAVVVFIVILIGLPILFGSNAWIFSWLPAGLVMFILIIAADETE